MPGRVVVDTNIVIAFFAGEAAVCEHFRHVKIAVPSIVVGELHYGARKSAHSAANLAKIDEFTASVAIVNCDAQTARNYGEIKDRLRLKGRPIPDNDIWIAAVARQLRLPLASRDEHFKEVPGLTLSAW